MKSIKEVRNVKLIKNIKKEIIIVDNNSNDGTLEKLKKFKKDLETLIIFQNQNYGKGNSIIEGLKHAQRRVCDISGCRFRI